MRLASSSAQKLFLALAFALLLGLVYQCADSIYSGGKASEYDHRGSGANSGDIYRCYVVSRDLEHSISGERYILDILWTDDQPVWIRHRSIHTLAVDQSFYGGHPVGSRFYVLVWSDKAVAYGDDRRCQSKTALHPDSISKRSRFCLGFTAVALVLVCAVWLIYELIARQGRHRLRAGHLQ